MAGDPNELFPEVQNLYEFPSVHADMVYDEHRVHAYEDAIRRSVREGDVVVDVGTGTGLLAFLSLRAGASRVHAIERSAVIESARRLARDNGFTDRITFYHADSLAVTLPEEADVVVSELIGHAAFEEGMAEALFDANRRFLKPRGRMIPQGVTLFAAPVEEREVYRSAIECWRTAYGFDFSAMRAAALKTSYVTELLPSDILAPQQAVLSANFATCNRADRKDSFTFRMNRAGCLNGIAFWFDATLHEHSLLSSSPWSRTHWLQTFTPLALPLFVKGGDIVNVTVDLDFLWSRNKWIRVGAAVESEVAYAET